MPPFRIEEFLVAKKSLPDRVHPFQLLKPILDRCDAMKYFKVMPIVMINPSLHKTAY